MIWLQIGLGAAMVIVATFVLLLITERLDLRAARKATVRQREFEADAAMVRTVQDTVAAMFDAVRRQQ